MTRLIIGLGNPGDQYEGTRHNIGFEVLDALAKRWGIEYKTKRRFSAEVSEAKRGDTTRVLAKPLTYMNLSGQSVAALRAWYKCATGEIAVLFDDADLALGQLRVRGSGSSGGHRGMQSVIDALGTNEIVRMRLGIGRQDGKHRGELADHVLRRFDAGERATVRELVTRAADAVESWLERGLAATMNDFNKRTKEAE